VVAETAWLVDRQLGSGAEATFHRSLASGELVVEDLVTADWARVAELVETYADLHLGGVDASIIAIAERLGITEIATLDRRHFTVVRPRHTDALILLP
jgi:predicted nucleic acid-binding protein